LRDRGRSGVQTDRQEFDRRANACHTGRRRQQHRDPDGIEPGENRQSAMTRLLFACAALSAVVTTTSAQSPPASWLDRPLASWNKPGASVPAAPRDRNVNESRESIVARCRLTPPRSTAAERAVDAAGWIPFWNFDQPLVRDDVEIVGGMRGADGMCRPASYNVFVFVGGRFAGLL